MRENDFHKKLKDKMDEFVHFVYDLTRSFPKEELFGITSQLRRAALSVILNYIEGFARDSKKSYLNFLKISYGSLKETKYLLYFSFKEKYITKNRYLKAIKMSEEINIYFYFRANEIIFIILKYN